MTPCPPACPCKVPHYDPERRLISVYSTGAFATVDEVEPGVFAYRYLPTHARQSDK